MFPLLPLLFVDVTTILLIVEPDGTDVLLIVKEPRAEVATVSFVPKKEFNIPTECRDDPEVNAVGVISNVIVILSILVDTFISKISFPMQPGPEIGSISDA